MVAVNPGFPLPGGIARFTPLRWTRGRKVYYNVNKVGIFRAKYPYPGNKGEAVK
jgi:hypothetical protein